MELLASSFLYSTLAGLLLFGFGLAIRLGHFKRMLIKKKTAGLDSRHAGYALMPAGLFLVSIYPIFLWKGEQATQELPSLIILVLLFFLPVITLLWQPRWLKPNWFQWLETNYGHVLEKMFTIARRMGPSTWETQVKTQADLERWADKIAQKHKWKRLASE